MNEPSTTAAELFFEDFTGNEGQERFEWGVYHRNAGWQIAGEPLQSTGWGNAFHGGSWTGDDVKEFRGQRWGRKMATRTAAIVRELGVETKLTVASHSTRNLALGQIRVEFHELSLDYHVVY